ncbi:MAG: hypothetical protein KDD67_13930 [Ignavibacteriae bacterium]|nr:hypothetical protein [Ignavibacteriota bacterium]MCB9216113.1 hypothetical protein [Ignavibacteria bacterium]
MTGQSADWLLDGEANSEATQPSPQHIPLFLTPVPAGAPTPGDDHVETWFSCQNVIPHPENSFACRVTGDSMIGAGIEAGDILIVEKREAQEEDIAIVSINSELTVKRIRSINGVTYLYPENERYKATAVSEEDSLTVWGVVIHSIKPH